MTTAPAPLAAFTLPLRLVSEANAHGHWRLRQRRAKAQRATAAWVARPLIGRMLGDHPGLIVTITRVAPRELDSDNLVGSAKHVRDGLADALGINDRDPRTEWHVAQRKSAGERVRGAAYWVEVAIAPKEMWRGHDQKKQESLAIKFQGGTACRPHDDCRRAR
jgi:hypothetical protein